MLKFLICRFLSLSTSLFLWKTSLCNWIYVEFVSKILIPSEYQDSILRMFRNLPLNVVILASWKTTTKIYTSFLSRMVTIKQSNFCVRFFSRMHQKVSYKHSYSTRLWTTNKIESHTRVCVGAELTINNYLVLLACEIVILILEFII
jgi:hypothetical protein